MLWDCMFYDIQKKEIGTKTVKIGPFSLVADPEDEQPDPPEPPNLTTTHDPTKTPDVNVACSRGDPHIRTFDGLKYDCQSEGINVLVKSRKTQREVQAMWRSSP